MVYQGIKGNNKGKRQQQKDDVDARAIFFQQEEN